MVYLAAIMNIHITKEFLGVKSNGMALTKRQVGRIYREYNNNKSLSARNKSAINSFLFVESRTNFM